MQKDIPNKDENTKVLPSADRKLEAKIEENVGSFESPELTVELDYSDESLICRIFQLESPTIYENMLPFLYEKPHITRVLEYLVKDYLGEGKSLGDGSEFTDRRCEKINNFLTSNITYLKSLLNHQGCYIITTTMQALLYNNTRGTANPYELSLFIKVLLIKLPDIILPCIHQGQIRRMLMSLVDIRPVYDILVIVLNYPEKRDSLDDLKLKVDEEEDNEDMSEVMDSFNVSNVVLRRHIRTLYQMHIIPSIIVVITEESSGAELSHLLCMLLSDVLVKYSYNEKYVIIIRELRDEELIHRLVMLVKIHPNPYILRLLERILFLISVPEIAVCPDNYIRFGLMVDDYLDNEFMQFAPQIYNNISIYVMFLIKQVYRHLPSAGDLGTALDARFHLIENFQLGDVSKANADRVTEDMKIGSTPQLLLHIIYYIVLGFSCKRGENISITEDINVLFWNLIYALPFVYDHFDILNSLLREYHAMFIFNRINHVLIHILTNTPYMQYCYEEYINLHSPLRPHIRVVIHQLRLRSSQIRLEKSSMPEERQLSSLLDEDSYYQKLLPLVAADSTREVCLLKGKKVLENGIMKDVLDCSTESILKEADVSRCLELGHDTFVWIICSSVFANKLGFHI